MQHIPVVSALHVEGRGWTCSSSDWLHMALGFNCITLCPIAEPSLLFHDGDEYTWDCVRSALN